MEMKMGTINSPDILETADKVWQQFSYASHECYEAHMEWRYQPTLSNAIRRDDAAKIMNGLHDAASLALAIIEANRSPDAADLPALNAVQPTKEREVERLLGYALFNLGKGKLGAVETLLRKAYAAQTGEEWDS